MNDIITMQKCQEQKEYILEQINSIPSNWKLWIYFSKDNSVTTTTVTENTEWRGGKALISTWYHHPYKLTWDKIEEGLTLDMYPRYQKRLQEERGNEKKNI